MECESNTKPSRKWVYIAILVNDYILGMKFQDHGMGWLKPGFPAAGLWMHDYVSCPRAQAKYLS